MTIARRQFLQLNGAGLLAVAPQADKSARNGHRPACGRPSPFCHVRPVGVRITFVQCSSARPGPGSTST